MCCTTVARFLNLCPYILGSDYRFSEDSDICSTKDYYSLVQLTPDHGLSWALGLWLMVNLVPLKIHVNEVPDQWMSHDRYNQSCCCPLQGDRTENHRGTLFFEGFTEPLHNPGKLKNNVFDITELHCRISGNFCMLHQKIFVRNQMT